MKNEDAALKGESNEKPSETKKRSLSIRKKRKIVVGSIIILIALVIIFWGWSETGNRNYLSVSQVLAEEELIAMNASKYCNVVIEVQGVVSEWDGISHLFRLVDKENASMGIEINATGILPDGFGIGKTIIARGMLLNELPITLVADGITIGCSSKY